MKTRYLFSFAALCLLFSLSIAQKTNHATTDNGTWLYIDSIDIPSVKQHLNHGSIFKKYVNGYNLSVLKAVDVVQSHAIDGGGYFIGIKAKPTESPIGYELKLLGTSMLTPPRPTSYCSGSSYGVFIETLNLIFGDSVSKISPDRAEAFRMQEPDGSRREDYIKFWGKWNADGWGTQYALVQYSGMGEEVTPERARPGDFANISWTSGLGHSVVFLGWFKKNNELGMVFWSSQKGTNGFGDVAMCPLSKVKSVKIVRLTHPEKVFTFDVQQTVKRDLPGDVIGSTKP
jgi:hypothetical protein